MADDLVFHYDPEPIEAPAGVTEGWIVIWDRKSMTGHAAKAAMLVEGDGSGSFVPNGEFEPVRITAD